MKYTLGYVCFVVVMLWFLVVHIIHLTIFFRVTSLPLGQSYDCPSASDVTLNDIGKLIITSPQQYINHVHISVGCYLYIHITRLRRIKWLHLYLLVLFCCFCLLLFTFHIHVFFFVQNVTWLWFYHLYLVFFILYFFQHWFLLPTAWLLKLIYSIKYISYIVCIFSTFMFTSMVQGRLYNCASAIISEAILKNMGKWINWKAPAFLLIEKNLASK